MNSPELLGQLAQHSCYNQSEFLMSKLSPEWRRTTVLEAVFDQLSDALVLYDPEFTITGVNRAAEKLFGMTSDEINFGSDMGTALDNLFKRVGHEDLLYLTMALKIQTETGGNLAEILARLSGLLRQRTMLRLKVRAISAEGRLSAVFLTAMPFLLFGIVTLLRPDYYTSVRDHPIVMPLLAVALILLLVGNVIIYRMVNFKV